MLDLTVSFHFRFSSMLMLKFLILMRSNYKLFRLGLISEDDFRCLIAVQGFSSMNEFKGPPAVGPGHIRHRFNRTGSFFLQLFEVTGNRKTRLAAMIVERGQP